MTPEIENEQLRTRLAEMAAEVERLRANIERLSTSDEYWNAQCTCGHRWYAVMPTESCPSCNPAPRITEHDLNRAVAAELECIANTVELAEGSTIERQNALCHAANVIRSHIKELPVDGLLSPSITEQDDIATIEQLVNDLYSEIEARFTPETLKYESMKRKYDNDMHTVNRGLALLDKLNGVKNAQ